MIEAMGTIPEVEAVGLVNGYPPPGLYRWQPGRCVQGRNHRSKACERRCHAFPV